MLQIPVVFALIERISIRKAHHRSLIIFFTLSMILCLLEVSGVDTVSTKPSGVYPKLYHEKSNHLILRAVLPFNSTILH